MEKLCKELDDAKATMEKLVAENRIKTELSDSLREVHNEQTVKLKEVKSVIEKQEQELNAKAEEIAVTKQMYEDVRVKLHEKESALKHLRAANDKFRSDSNEKLQKMGEENRELVLALDEANTRTTEQEMKNNAFKEEIERLKGLVYATQKKCSEAEEKAKAIKDMRHKDDLVMKVEEENSKIKEQLKWKKEQFKHLEEAHEKIQDLFRLSKKEWEKEKSKLLDEMCALHASLDSQTRITESLQCQLQMCNQALAHEESRRKLLEVQVSESRISYENVYADYQEAKTKIASLTSRRDEEIAELRNLLGRKESLYKEAEFRREHLEHENQDLRRWLKEFQEAQIQEAGTASSVSKLRNKLRGLEHVHKECSTILKAREAEWNSQMESTMRDLNECKSELNGKDQQIGQLHMELEGCQCSIMQLELENLEIDAMLTVFKSVVSDAQSMMLSSPETEIESNMKEEDGQVALLLEQLEQKNKDMVRAYNVIEQERDVVASLARKIESLDPVEQKYFLVQKELERYKELHEESEVHTIYLKEHALHMENALKEELAKVYDDLNDMSTELAQKSNEISEVEFELDTWKSVAENLKYCLDESLEVRREMEASLLAQVETEQNLKQEKENLLRVVEAKEKCVCDLKQQIVLLEQELGVAAREFPEKEHLLGVVEEMEKSIENFKLPTDQLYQEIVKGETEIAILAKVETEKAVNQETKRLLSIVERKDKIIDDLRLQINTIHEALQKIIIALVISETEIQEKNLVVSELQTEMTSLLQKLELQEKAISRLKQKDDYIRAEFEARQLKMGEDMDQLASQLSTSQALVEKLEFQKGVLLQDIMKMSSERGDLLAIMEGLYEQISELSNKDVELMGRIERLVQSFDFNSGELRDSKEFYDANGENVRSHLPSLTKNVEEHKDERSPLKERNA